MFGRPTKQEKALRTWRIAFRYPSPQNVIENWLKRKGLVRSAQTFACHRTFWGMHYFNKSLHKDRSTNVCSFELTITAKFFLHPSARPNSNAEKILCSICSGFDFRGTPQHLSLSFSVSHRRRNTSFGMASALCKHWPLIISDRIWQANGLTCKISLTHLHTSPLGCGTSSPHDIYGPRQRWDCSLFFVHQ